MNLDPQPSSFMLSQQGPVPLIIFSVYHDGLLHYPWFCRRRTSALSTAASINTECLQVQRPLLTRKRLLSIRKLWNTHQPICSTGLLSHSLSKVAMFRARCTVSICSQSLLSRYLSTNTDMGIIIPIYDPKTDFSIKLSGPLRDKKRTT